MSNTVLENEYIAGNKPYVVPMLMELAYKKEEINNKQAW